MSLLLWIVFWDHCTWRRMMWYSLYLLNMVWTTILYFVCRYSYLLSQNWTFLKTINCNTLQEHLEMLTEMRHIRYQLQHFNMGVYGKLVFIEFYLYVLTYPSNLFIKRQWWWEPYYIYRFPLDAQWWQRKRHEHVVPYGKSVYISVIPVHPRKILM